MTNQSKTIQSKTMIKRDAGVLPGLMNATFKDAQDAMLEEYFEKHAAKHNEICSRYDTITGRIDVVREQYPDVPDYELLSYFIEFEHGCRFSSRLTMYMPTKREDKPYKSKIIIDSSGRERLFVEIQIAGLSIFDEPREDILDDNSFSPVRRIYNLRLASSSVVPFVRDFLFSSRFTHRSLMTIDAKVLSSMTAQRLLSGVGQLSAFKQWVLNK
jgi:hypothetical protein